MKPGPDIAASSSEHHLSDLKFRWPEFRPHDHDSSLAMNSVSLLFPVICMGTRPKNPKPIIARYVFPSFPLMLPIQLIFSGKELELIRTLRDCMKIMRHIIYRVLRRDPLYSSITFHTAPKSGNKLYTILLTYFFLPFFFLFFFFFLFLFLFFLPMCDLLALVSYICFKF